MPLNKDAIKTRNFCLRYSIKEDIVNISGDLHAIILVANLYYDNKTQKSEMINQVIRETSNGESLLLIPFGNKFNALLQDLHNVSNVSVSTF